MKVQKTKKKYSRLFAKITWYDNGTKESKEEQYKETMAFLTAKYEDKRNQSSYKSCTLRLGRFINGLPKLLIH